jgi:hypothetical protein
MAKTASWRNTRATEAISLVYGGDVVLSGLEWFAVPTDTQKGSQARGMELPAIEPLGYRSWPTHQQGMFWNLFFASARAGGYLPAGSGLWQIAGALTRARWDANCAAVLAAFGCTLPDADGRVMIYYPPLLKILTQQTRKLEASAKRSMSRTETSTGSTGNPKCSTSSLSLDLEFDLKKEREKEENKKPPNTSGPPCKFCQNTGVRYFKPPRKGEFWCHCPIGVKGMKQQNSFAATGD